MSILTIKIMDKNRIHMGTYELLLEFDAFGDLNPETMRRIKHFLQAMKGQARTSAIATLTLKFDEDCLDRRWMRKTENDTRTALRNLGANWEDIEGLAKTARRAEPKENVYTIGDVLEDIHHGITPNPKNGVNVTNDSMDDDKHQYRDYAAKYLGVEQ
jgi:hypothetical protein